MSVLKFQATADPDGRLRLDLPARPGWTYDIQVVVTVAPPVPADATPDERGEWPQDFLDNVLGSIDDDTFVAPDRGLPAPSGPAG